MTSNELLMMFIKDAYSAPSGNPSKKTVLAVIKYVGKDEDLQQKISSSDWDGVLNHSATSRDKLVVEIETADIDRESVEYYLSEGEIAYKVL